MVHAATHATLGACIALTLVAMPTAVFAQASDQRAQERLLPGISVLLDEQVSLVRNRRIALIVDPSVRDDRGRAVEALLTRDRRASGARVEVVATVHVASGDRGMAADTIEARRVRTLIDSLAAPLEAIVVDVQDRGTRSGPAPWVVLAMLHASTRRDIPIIVLDRPNPLTGEHTEGPAADSVAWASEALYGLPSRHGMTIGEIALWFNEVGQIGASLTVVPVRGWRRSLWPTDLGAAIAKIDGSDTRAESLILSGAFAPFDATNLRVHRHDNRSIRIGAGWLDANRLAQTLGDRLMPGVRYTASRDRFVDSSGRSVTLPSLRIEITDRDRASGWRVMAAVLATVRAAHRDSLSFDGTAFDFSTGTPRLRAAIEAGEDSDALVDDALGTVIGFRRRVRQLLLYR
ncbi:MAG: DUF1343 domain-containing protein [Gemmatimonadetes bacterium]|nr:DUF1343 domain-containing protein [Gemmatimonadota bacterium]